MHDFPTASKADWLARVEKELKGKPLASFDRTLANGQTISPFADRSDLPEAPERPFVGTDPTWTTGVTLTVSDAAASNREMLALLNNGAGAVHLIFSDIPDFTVLFAGVQCAWVRWYFTLGATVEPVLFVQEWHAHLGDKRAETRYYFTNRQIGSRHFSNDDAHIIAEIADYRAALARTSDLDHTHLSATVSDQYLLSIAKLRAINVLYQRRRAALNLPPARPHLTVEVGPETYIDDENTNKIRATAHAMAAVVGGASVVFVHPSDATAAGEGSAFNRRISLNVQHLLQMESYLDRVGDPAAGSYYLEALTAKLLVEKN